MIARIGSMVAPFILSLKLVNAAYPAIILGTMPLIGAILVLFLPETQGSVWTIFTCFSQIYLTNAEYSWFFAFFQLNLGIHCRQQLKMLKISEEKPRNDSNDE